jgi:hypothetical protein
MSASRQKRTFLNVALLARLRRSVLPKLKLRKTPHWLRYKNGETINRLKEHLLTWFRRRARSVRRSSDVAALAKEVELASHVRASAVRLRAARLLSRIASCRHVEYLGAPARPSVLSELARLLPERHRPRETAATRTPQSDIASRFMASLEGSLRGPGRCKKCKEFSLRWNARAAAPESSTAALDFRAPTDL